MWNTDFLNQNALEQEIYSLEAWYVKSLIETIKTPIFKERIEKDITEIEENLEKLEDNEENSEEREKFEKKKQELTWMLEKNKLNEKWHSESLENLETILESVYKLRKK